MNALSVIIPSRNAANLVPCVRAIRGAGETCRIIVVDDGVEWPGWTETECPLPEGFGDVYVLGADHVKPFIFARNINIGIREAGSDDVILLNDDALLKTPLGFTKLQRAYFDAKSACGVVSATMHNVGNANQFPKALTPTMRDEPRTLCFVCVFIPRVVIDIVGLLDERFAGYGLDDDDYCLRCRNVGLKLGIFDGCYVDHGSLTSSFRGLAGAGGDFSGNMRLFIEKWGFDNWNRPRETSQFRHLFPAEVNA